MAPPIFDPGANNKTVLEKIVEDSKHYLTRKRFNKSDDAILAGFLEESWECIDAEKGILSQEGLSVEVNYYFFPGSFTTWRRRASRSVRGRS